MNDSTKTVVPANRTITGICEHLRSEVAAADWRALSGRTDSGLIDKAAILTELDIAQWTGRLAPFISARDIAIGAGVRHPTATASMKRLDSQGWHYCLNARRHQRDAETYAINPDFPLAYNFRQPRAGKTLLRAAAGDPTFHGDHGVYTVESHRERMRQPERKKKDKLQEWLLSPVGTFTQEGTRRWLLLCRTETGIALGKTAIAVYLALDDNTGLTVGDIAEVVRIPHNTVSNALQKLEKLSLAYSQGKLWTLGAIPIEQFDPGTLRMERRLGEIEDQRWSYALRFPVSQEEFFRVELSRAASKIRANFDQAHGFTPLDT